MKKSNSMLAGAVFGGRDCKCDGRVFEGGNLIAIFGGVECDLKNAIIEKDCTIRAAAIFGGIDIVIPEGVNVMVSSISIFGGVSNLTTPPVGRSYPLHKVL